MNTRWPAWRRDLLFAVLGAVIAAAVLIPLGEIRLRVAKGHLKAVEDELRARAESEFVRLAAQASQANRP